MLRFFSQTLNFEAVLVLVNNFWVTFENTKNTCTLHVTALNAMHVCCKRIDMA